MATVTIEEKGCRGCTMCVDVCPVDVFEFDDAGFVAKVARTEDCIGCLSCVYVCPSRCVEVADVELLRPFHRIEHHAALVERLLQGDSQRTTVVEDDWAEAQRDVAVRLDALGGAVTETMGRGQKAVGRKAGGLAAEHMPEMYEEEDLDGVLRRMQRRFRHAFTFDYAILDGEDGKEVELTFTPCGLNRVVTDAGGELGKHVLCELFHEYWSGLLGAFVKGRYRCKMPDVGQHCRMHLSPS
jgi:NAD-dependent dihydropyrimidine dehydrogenase PreA subunit